ncbi:MAG TPA: hypothetical protein VFX30_06980 [bacterium]|nr:hypothetical protein [bacterium]
MSPPDPISPGSSSVLPNPPVTDRPPDRPPPPSPSTTQGSIRLGYRLTYGGSVTAHGIQLIGNTVFRISPYFRLTLQLENNFMFAASDRPPSDLTRDAVLGSNFEGVRNSRYGGSVFTDVTGGTAVANQTFGFEMIPETQAMFRPAPDFPFELGARFGFGITYTSLHTTTRVTTEPPGSHSGPGGCIPGDIHCDEAPIPEPSAGAGYGPFEADAGTWAWYVRFGPRIAFPVNDYFQAGTECLFRSNATGGFDGLWRTNIRLAVPIGDHFLLFADPRFILSVPQDKPVAPGFDVVAGGIARF